MESSSFSGSSKRAKALSHITQVANCLVDGCNADLSLCRDYHRRHKVCEAHSKTSRVTIGGREQRFCQQCSRFHSLVEFDEGKRSCRKRLDGHNRRRRKPQSDSLPRNAGLLFSGQPGTRLLSFSNPQILPSSVMSSSSWTSIIKPENNIALYNNQQQLNYLERQNSFTEPSNGYNKSINSLQFMQGLDPTNSATRPTNSSKLFFDGINQVVDSDRALSLLSSAPSATREFGLNHAVQQEPLPQALHDLHYSGLSQYSFASQESKTNLSSHASDASTLHFPKAFHHHGHEGSSSSGSHQTLTFNMWE